MRFVIAIGVLLAVFVGGYQYGRYVEQIRVPSALSAQAVKWTDFTKPPYGRRATPEEMAERVRSLSPDALNASAVLVRLQNTTPAGTARPAGRLYPIEVSQ